MSLEHKTSERFTPKAEGQLGGDNVVKYDRVFAVHGPKFAEYLMKAVMPARQEVAMLALSKTLEETMRAPVGTFVQAIDLAVERAFMIADAFCLASPHALDRNLTKYFDLYMQRGKIDDILKAQVEAGTDYSLHV